MDLEEIDFCPVDRLERHLERSDELPRRPERPAPPAPRVGGRYAGPQGVVTVRAVRAALVWFDRAGVADFAGLDEFARRYPEQL